MRKILSLHLSFGTLVIAFTNVYSFAGHFKAFREIGILHTHLRALFHCIYEEKQLHDLNVTDQIQWGEE